MQPHFSTVEDILLYEPSLQGRLRGWVDGPSGLLSLPGAAPDDGIGGQGGLAAFESPALSAWPETMTGAMARYSEAFQRLPSRFPVGNILVVSHGDAVAQFISMTQKISKELVYQVPFCAVAGAQMELRRAPDGGVGLPAWVEGATSVSEHVLILQD
mmetsp:Transcript_70557/g.146950  ORF Transcript_70557/g.146950 Transcript_70557/m.146950 type:complete len:157 (-) Transcript_70557:214-684(-)